MKIVIKNLQKKYKEKLVLDIPYLEFKENIAYCIKGRNGTGKTTLLKIIANLLPFDTGDILYNGEHIQKDLLKDVTYLSPSPYIFNSSVLDNIRYPLRLRKLDEKLIVQLVDDYLEYFELSHIKHQNALKCSSGEKMKIALSRSLVFKPKLLLLDEPTTNLDVESIEKLKTKLLEIKKETTIIFISHDISFINQMSDTTYVLKDTKIEIGD